MKVAVLFAFLVAGTSAAPFVWDIIKAPLKSDEVLDIIANAVPGQSFPIYAEIPQTDFQCSAQRYSGYFADVSTQCQVFHRCDLEGVLTSYLCPNTTVFDQIRLVCDYFYNVDCARGAQYVDFANSRLNTDQDLFDTPPQDYVVPWERNLQGRDLPVGGSSDAATTKRAGVTTKAATKAGVTTKAAGVTTKAAGVTTKATARPVPGGRVTTTQATTTPAQEEPIDETTEAAPEDGAASDATDATEAPADQDQTPEARDDAAETTEAPADAGEETTEAPQEDTTEAAAEDTTEAPAEDTTEAAAEDTTEAAAEDTTEAAAEETTEAAADDQSADATPAPELRK